MVLGSHVAWGIALPTILTSAACELAREKGQPLHKGPHTDVLGTPSLGTPLSDWLRRGRSWEVPKRAVSHTLQFSCNVDALHEAKRAHGRTRGHLHLDECRETPCCNTPPHTWNRWTHAPPATSAPPQAHTQDLGAWHATQGSRSRSHRHT